MATNRGSNKRTNSEKDANADPLTGEPGSHPVGAGIGAAMGGAAAGAAAGAVGGPVGAAVGAIVGGVAGGFAGKAAAEALDPTEEEAYWRQSYPDRPYYDGAVPYETYAPAYQYGWESRSQFSNRRYDEVEPELERNWRDSGRVREMEWENARPAVRDAWDRVDERWPDETQK